LRFEGKPGAEAAAGEEEAAEQILMLVLSFDGESLNNQHFMFPSITNTYIRLSISLSFSSHLKAQQMYCVSLSKPFMRQSNIFNIELLFYRALLFKWLSSSSILLFCVFLNSMKHCSLSLRQMQKETQSISWGLR
jgi:hypothetical protein